MINPTIETLISTIRENLNELETEIKEFEDILRKEAYNDGYEDGAGDNVDAGYDAGYEAGLEEGRAQVD